MNASATANHHGRWASRWTPYPAYLHSGVEWLGEVPEGWALRRLKFAALSPRLVAAEERDFIGLEQVASWVGRLVSGGDQRTAEQDGIAAEAGDVLLGKLRPYLAKGWLVDRPVRASSEFLVLRPRSALHAQFLLYRCIEAGMIDYLTSLTFGTKMPRVSPSEALNAWIPLPPLPEQRAIAAFLDRETANLDTLVAKKERLLELLDEKRTALISQAVTKGLDPDVPLKDSGVEWLGEVPEGWEAKELRHLVARGTSITYGIVQAGPDVPDGVPYIRTSDMSGDALPREGYKRTSHEIDASYSRSRVRVGDVVVAIRATVGKALPVPEYLDGANLTQGTAKIAPGPRLTTTHLLYALSSRQSQDRFGALGKGATFREITLDMLRRFPIPLPPLPEQRAIAAYLDRETARIDALKSKIQRAMDLLKEYRTALISAAVTGKIDVRGEISDSAA